MPYIGKRLVPPNVRPSQPLYLVIVIIVILRMKKSGLIIVAVEQFGMEMPREGEFLEGEAIGPPPKIIYSQRGIVLSVVVVVIILIPISVIVITVWFVVIHKEDDFRGIGNANVLV